VGAVLIVLAWVAHRATTHTEPEDIADGELAPVSGVNVSNSVASCKFGSTGREGGASGLGTGNACRLAEAVLLAAAESLLPTGLALSSMKSSGHVKRKNMCRLTIKME
jgi:hypothetical protein